MPFSIDVKNILSGLSNINNELLALSTPISIEDALKREPQILHEADAVGMEYDLPEERTPRGRELARIEQRLRMDRAGIRCMGRNMVITYEIPMESDNMLTELVFSYDEDKKTSKVYTRTVDSSGNRCALELDDAEMLKIGMAFGLMHADDAQDGHMAQMSQVM